MTSSLRMVAQHPPGVDAPFLHVPARDTPSPPGSLSDILHTPYLDVLSAALPAAAILLALSKDVLTRASYPAPLRRAARTLSSPFRDFFRLSDLEAPTPAPLHPFRAQWKARVLVIGAVLQSIAALAILAYREEVGDTHRAVHAGIVFLAWVRTPTPLSPSLPPLFCRR